MELLLFYLTGEPEITISGQVEWGNEQEEKKFQKLFFLQIGEKKNSRRRDNDNDDDDDDETELFPCDHAWRNERDIWSHPSIVFNILLASSSTTTIIYIKRWSLDKRNLIVADILVHLLNS